MTTEPIPSPEKREPRGPRSTHPALYLTVALALVGNVALLMHSRTMARALDDLRASTQAEMSRFNEQLAASRAASDQRLDAVALEARESVESARAKTLTEARTNQAGLAAKLAETREAQHQAEQHVAGELDEMKQAHNSTVLKLDAISGDVTGVKGDVASTRSEVEGHNTELKRVAGDMGVMSGLIATNGKELAALREFGERNYVEFDLKRKSQAQKVGGIQLSLAKADPKRNRFTLNVVADDKVLEKRDRTINEPVQLYVSGNRQPIEIVVNEVKKDEVVGYVSVPKVTSARR